MSEVNTFDNRIMPAIVRISKFGTVVRGVTDEIFHCPQISVRSDDANWVNKPLRPT